jgi:hypothetical protein
VNDLPTNSSAGAFQEALERGGLMYERDPITFMVDRRARQRSAVSILAVNALMRSPLLRPAPEMLARAYAPTDEAWEADTEGTARWWGKLVERAIEVYQVRPRY